MRFEIAREDWKESMPENGRYTARVCKIIFSRLLQVLNENTNFGIVVDSSDVEKVLGTSEYGFFCSCHSDDLFTAVKQAKDITYTNTILRSSRRLALIVAPKESYADTDSALFQLTESEENQLVWGLALDSEIDEYFAILFVGIKTQSQNR